jgi:hypothetical protein
LRHRRPSEYFATCCTSKDREDIPSRPQESCLQKISIWTLEREHCFQAQLVSIALCLRGPNIRRTQRIS